MPSREELLTYIPSQAEVSAFFASEKGHWLVWAGLGLFLLLVILWALRRKRHALNNLGLSRVRREWLHTVSDKREPVTYTVDDGIRANEEPPEPLPTTPQRMAPLPPIPSAPAATPVATPASAPAQSPTPVEPAFAAVHDTPDDIPPVLGRLPFCRRPGLQTASVTLPELPDLKVEAVFVDAKLLESFQQEPALWQLPFVPEATLLTRFDNVYRRGALIAQPSAIAQVSTGLAVITNAVSTTPLTLTDGWALALRPDELLLATINAMVVAHELSQPCAPILSFPGARLFLRPSPSLVTELVLRQGAAQAFAMSVSHRQTLNSVIYATLFAAARA